MWVVVVSWLKPYFELIMLSYHNLYCFFDFAMHIILDDSDLKYLADVIEISEDIASLSDSCKISLFPTAVHF